jgi:cell division protease FtsH
MSKQQNSKRSNRVKGNIPKPPNKNNKKNNFNFYWIYAIIAVVLISLNLFNWGPTLTPTTFPKFKEMVQDGDVNKVIIYNYEKAKVFIKAESLEKYEDKLQQPLIGENSQKGPHFEFTPPKGDFFTQQLDEWQTKYDLSYDFIQQDNWGRDILGWLIPIGLMFGLWILIMRRMSGGGGPGGQIFNIGKSKATLFDKEQGVKINFKDVAGLEEAKEEVMEIVDFLKNPKRYTTLGAKIPKGALLVGPPGTGKTLLAKAVAGVAQVPFFSLSGSDFVEMFVGVGASRVRDLFKQAKEKAPCIIFIDEIDAIGRARGKNAMQGSNDERENTLNQLLTEMDGFGTNSGVIILAATNRADVLDRALLRPGRFDRQINVDLPEKEERKAIFKVHLKPLKLKDSVDIEFLASQTPGFSGAEIANLCNEAALIAARKKKKEIDKQDFLDAVDRIIAGLEKKSKIITPEEKKTIAFHEAGHATVSWLLEHASPLVKVTIVPRGRSLGAAWYLPEERQITTKKQLFDEMCAALGGRAAEEITFNEISTGALSDLEKITKQAYAMVKMYGLNEKIGNISYYDSSGQNDYNFTKPYSDTTADVIDKEVSKLIESMYVRTKNLLIENQDKLNELAELLLEKEVIFREDLERIFGKRKFETKADITAEQIRLTEKQAKESKSDNGQSPKELPSKDEKTEEKPKSDSGSDQNTDDKKNSKESDKKEESTSDNTSK